MPADLLLLVGLRALVAGLLGLRRAALHQPDGQQDVQRELQILRLPVLEDGVAEARRHDVAAQRDRRLVVGRRLVVEVLPAGHRLTGEGEREEGEEDERQRVRPEGSPHQWWASPMVAYSTRPVAMTSR